MQIKDDIFIFSTSENGVYDKQILKLLGKYNDVQSRIWESGKWKQNQVQGRPPEPVSDRQSFDVACRKENRNPLKNNIKGNSTDICTKNHCSNIVASLQ